MSTAIHINAEPYEEIVRKPDGERHCFVCRKRRVFDYVAKRPTDPLSWYGPHAQIECTVCGTVDGDCFPGYSREWA